jgi:hypothetical protein
MRVSLVLGPNKHIVDITDLIIKEELNTDDSIDTLIETIIRLFITIDNASQGMRDLLTSLADGGHLEELEILKNLSRIIL